MDDRELKKHLLEERLDELQEEMWETALALIGGSNDAKEAQKTIKKIMQTNLANVASVAHFLELKELSMESGMEVDDDVGGEDAHDIEWSYQYECNTCEGGDVGYESEHNGDEISEQFKGFDDVRGEEKDER